MVGSGTCLPPAGLGGSQFTMTLWMGYAQTPEIENGYDPPISQVIHLPGTIQKGNTSIASQELLLYPVKHCTSTEPPGIIVLIRELMSAHELPTSANSATRASTTALLYHPYYSTTVALQ